MCKIFSIDSSCIKEHAAKWQQQSILSLSQGVNVQKKSTLLLSTKADADQTLLFQTDYPADLTA